MRPDTTTLAIEEKFTAEEKAEIAEQLACSVADLETIYGEKKESDAAFNARIKACDQKITELAKRYNKGCETAQIGCDIRYDQPEPGKKSYVRMDSGEVAQVIDMSWEEKQDTIQFPLTEAKPTEPKPPCEHETVSNLDGTWKCDKCGATLDDPEISVTIDETFKKNLEKIIDELPPAAKPPEADGTSA